MISDGSSNKERYPPLVKAKCQFRHMTYSSTDKPEIVHESSWEHGENNDVVRCSVSHFLTKVTGGSGMFRACLLVAPTPVHTLLALVRQV